MRGHNCRGGGARAAVVSAADARMMPAEAPGGSAIIGFGGTPPSREAVMSARQLDQVEPVADAAFGERCHSL
jgi:hypothetical protein